MVSNFLQMLEPRILFFMLFYCITFCRLRTAKPIGLLSC